MADFDSSLPVRTVSTSELQVQTKAGTKLSVTTASPGDVVVKLVDTAGTNVAAVTAANALKVDGSGAIQPVSGTVTANIGTTGGLALDTSVNGLIVAQSSTTSGEKGVLVQGAVTTAAPTYTTGQTNPLSLTTGGLLRVDASGAAISVGVADKSTFTYGTSTFLGVGGAFQDTSPALTAGQEGVARLTANRGFHVNLRDASGNEKLGSSLSAASIPVVIASDQGAVAENQTQIGGNAIASGSGVTTSGTQRVVLATDQTVIPVSITSENTKVSSFQYSTASAVASAGISTQTYSPAATQQITAVTIAASGQMKADIQFGTTGSEVTIASIFTSKGSLSYTFVFPAYLSITTAQSIKVVRTNTDNQAQDLYSTIQTIQ